MKAGSLSLQGVQIRRSGRTILQVDHLSIPAGAFVGVIGTNGAGKTTLLKTAVGLIRPSTGYVFIDDLNLTRSNPWRRCHIRKRIGYIPQSTEYNADLPFTLREVVAMGRTSVRSLMTGLNHEDMAIVDRWIETLGLATRRDQTFRSLSGGERQKALIARAMTQDPEILMLDEPCANLDFNWKHQISEIVEQLHRQTDVTVIMVSHDTAVLPQSCQRIVLLSAGQIIADGQPDQVLTSETLARVYDGMFQMLTIGDRRHTINVPSERKG